MALRNREDLPELGKRLHILMDRYNKSVPEDERINSPKDLATALYDAKLVQVNTRENFNSDEINKNNAIGSIEKKIVRHMTTGVVSDKNGDYLLAYAKFFECSSDYILGLTDIISNSMEVRQICQLLGFPEGLVLELIKCQKNGNYAVPSCWSILMGSHLLYSVPEDMVAMGNEIQKTYQHEGELKALQWLSGKVIGPDLMDIRLDIEGMGQQIESDRSAFYGRLSKVSRNFEEIIEAHICQCNEEFRKRFAKAMMDDARTRYKSE